MDANVDQTHLVVRTGSQGRRQACDEPLNFGDCSRVLLLYVMAQPHCSKASGTRLSVLEISPVTITDRAADGVLELELSERALEWSLE